MSISLAPPPPPAITFRWGNGELNALAGAPELPDELRELIAEHTARFHDYLNARAAARQAEGAAKAADEADAAERARALASRRPAAAATAPAAHKAADKARQHEQDLINAIRLIEGRIVEVLRRDGHKIAAAIDEESERLRREAIAAADAIEQGFRRRHLLYLLRLTVAQPDVPQHWRPSYVTDTIVAGSLPEQVRNAVVTVRAHCGVQAPPEFGTVLGHL